jgi:hypothetical protein
MSFAVAAKHIAVCNRAALPRDLMIRQRQSSTRVVRNDPRNALLLSDDNIKCTGAETLIKVDSYACRTTLEYPDDSKRVTLEVARPCMLIMNVTRLDYAAFRVTAEPDAHGTSEPPSTGWAPCVTILGKYSTPGTNVHADCSAADGMFAVPIDSLEINIVHPAVQDRLAVKLGRWSRHCLRRHNSQQQERNCYRA